MIKSRRDRNIKREKELMEITLTTENII